MARVLSPMMFASLLASSAAQCGPGGSMPYPPGQTLCPSSGDGMGPHPDGGGTAPNSPGGTDTVTCNAPPCAASMLGDVGLTTASGTDTRSGITFQVGENIYGPFEAGFSTQQDFILEGLGCSSGSLGHVAGGIDTYTAEQMVAYQCSITLPRIENDRYISLLDECGGHTQEYHFHEKMSCLFTTAQGSGHSTQVGQAQGKYIYGKWEDFSSSEVPLLDACGGHFGATPDSSEAVVYHYHVQDNPPFTIGCYGPKEESSGVYKMLTVADCRALYDGCGDGDAATVTTSQGSKQYDFWCPCWDADGSNVGTNELAVFSEASSVYTCSGEECNPVMAADSAHSAVQCQISALIFILVLAVGGLSGIAA